MIFLEKYSKKIKICAGIFNLVLVGFGILTYFRMASIRAAIEFPDSGLFLARALLFIAVAGCFALAVVDFISTKFFFTKKIYKYVSAIAFITINIACLVCYLLTLRSINYEYATSAGTPLFSFLL